jgi:myo-inositol catabolism protein IolH
MRLCVETGAFQRLTLEQALEGIRAAGYDNVELNPDLFRPHEATSADIRRLRRLLADHGLHPAAVLPLYPIATPDEARRQEGVEKWKRAIAASRELGAEGLTSEMTGDPAAPPEACRHAFRRSIEALLPALDEADLRISFECHPGDFIERSREAVDLIRETRSPRVAYLYCLAHTFYLGDDPAAMIRDAGATLAHVHVADTYRPERIIQAGENGRPHLHAIPGWGELDFRAILRALKEIGYRGYLSAALFSHLEDPVSATREARERVEALLAELE